MWLGLPVLPPQRTGDERFPPHMGKLCCPKAEAGPAEQEQQLAWPAACHGHPRAAIQPSLSLGNKAERQGVSAREGAARAAGPATVRPALGSRGGGGTVPSVPRSRPLSPLQVSHLLQAVCAGVASGERTRASPGGVRPPLLAPSHSTGRGSPLLAHPVLSAGVGAAAAARVLTHAPLPQLFSLQAPLKTLLQLTIMPIINGRHRRCPHTPGLVQGHGGIWLHCTSPSLQRGLKRGCRSHCPKAWTSPRRWSPTMRYVAGWGWPGPPQRAQGPCPAGAGRSLTQPCANPLPFCRDSSRWELISTSPRGCGR